MEFLKNCKSFICREINEENEPKETAILIRVLCLVDFFFLAIASIIVVSKYGMVDGAGALLLSCLMVLVFFMSYKMKMSWLIYVYYSAIIVNMVMLVVTFGMQYMFQAQIYIVFMVFFYRAAGSSRERIISVVFSALTSILLGAYVSINGSLVVSTPTPLISACCTLYITAKAAVMAYFFRLKFSASEEKIIKYSKKLELLATTDPLTKLQNRRGMLNYMEERIKNIQEMHDGHMTIVIGDIDHFKVINDTYGHEAGDYILETLAKIMKDFMHGKGKVCRWGGEEFLFMFEGINGDYAFEETDRLLHLVSKFEFSYEGTPISVTMTFGIEEYDDYIGIDKVIAKADEKLYMGKNQGRNRVIY